MFKKLVSGLSYNPSLIRQVGFYADRLHQEKSIRRFSFLFIALAMVVQFFAVISPVERSLASSNNHIISGIETRDDILSAYDASDGDVKAIFAAFDISRTDLESLSETPDTTVRTNDGNAWLSIGRTSIGAIERVQDEFKASEEAIQYAGMDTETEADDAYVYQRYLRALSLIHISEPTRPY